LLIAAALAVTSVVTTNDRLVMLGLALGALAVVGGIAVAISRSTATRMRRVAAALEEAASGDLTKRVEIEASGEMGEIGRSLNVIIDRVSEVI